MSHSTHDLATHEEIVEDEELGEDYTELEHADEILRKFNAQARA